MNALSVTKKEQQQRRRNAFYEKNLSACGALYWQAEVSSFPAADLVLAPAVNLLVLWVLRRARESGIRRLYFLARDGYLLWKTAQKYCERYQLPVECRYLHCSRYALRLPLYHSDLPAAVESICSGGIGFCLERALLRSGLSPEELQEARSQISWPDGFLEPIRDDQLPELRRMLLQNQWYLERLRERSVAAQEPIAGYFRQEGLLDPVPMAVVDSGWTGSTQQSLNRLLEHFGKQEPVDGFYFGLYEHPVNCRHRYESLFLMPRRTFIDRALFCGGLLEALLPAPHGTTLGFEARSQGYGPVLGGVSQETLEFQEFLEGRLDGYTEGLLQRASIDALEQLDMEGMARKLMASFVRLSWAPTEREASLVGRLPFSDDLRDVHRQDLAPVLSRQMLCRNHLLTRLAAKLRGTKVLLPDTAWYEGSAVRSLGGRSWIHRINFALLKSLLQLKKQLGDRRRNTMG